MCGDELHKLRRLEEGGRGEHGSFVMHYACQIILV